MAHVLIDTSAWIDFFTHSASPAAEVVDRLIRNDLACVTGVVVTELLRGTRTTQARTLLLDKLQPLTFLETRREIWIAAGELAASLNQAGITLPLTDILIAAVAKASECSIYTTDAHFSRIPHVKLYHT